jgi:pilus assembly protein Flp/PilA
MIQLLAGRIQLAKMRAEEGQALVEYALIVSLIAVVAIAALTLTGHSIRDILNNIANDVYGAWTSEAAPAAPRCFPGP